MGIEEGNHKEPTTGERKPLTRCKRFSIHFATVCFIAGAIVGFIWFTEWCFREEPVQIPKIELASLYFTVLNITETRLSAKWDMSIRIPYDLPGDYICLQGDLQASFLYKNVTLATSSPQKYNNLKFRDPQVLKVSAGVSAEDTDGLTVKDITEDVKEKKEVHFGTRFYLTDCREKTTGTMRYACDDVTLRFEPGSEMKAGLPGKNPSCVNY
ncbi:hypothetical protein Rs2_39727 [Raphanus sativus]|uniref:Uncharacterized protein LOC108826840 n=1 Tax=Raphanus sativus TaxID=3726 RepID=A0A6J0L876_RAPSA|nr:uncharacterized protein LOC108826840 [Raphanus sativus]KAJ4874709.1 hypothetical protein Rs2_39727 [Raphanus sativus]